jgi:AcrR family transcriptional regulator
MARTGRRTGRRPGPTVTRAEILAAARRKFGERGYDGTTIRAIAAEAGVNQALVHHFFGTKEQIFIASVDFPVDPAVALPLILDGPREQFGERLARFLLSVWGNPVTRAPLLALLRSSAGNEQAAAMLRDLLGKVLFSRVATATGSSTMRIAAAAGQAVGLMLLRYVVQVEPLASATDEEIVAILAPVIQACLEP